MSQRWASDQPPPAFTLHRNISKPQSDPESLLYSKYASRSPHQLGVRMKKHDCVCIRSSRRTGLNNSQMCLSPNSSVLVVFLFFVCHVTILPQPSDRKSTQNQVASTRRRGWVQTAVAKMTKSKYFSKQQREVNLVSLYTRTFVFFYLFHHLLQIFLSQIVAEVRSPSF